MKFEIRAWRAKPIVDTKAEIVPIRLKFISEMVAMPIPIKIGITEQ